MRLTAIIILISLLTLGLVFLAADYIFPHPEEIAEDYLKAWSGEDFARLTSLHHPEEGEVPDGENIADTLEEFSQAFGLEAIEIAGLKTGDEGNNSPLATEADFKAVLNYSSEYFEDKEVEIELKLSRHISFADSGLFHWKVHWQDHLPLPEYGLEALYGRERLEPDRGAIYDRSGNMLAGSGSVVNIGVQPGRIENPDRLFQVLEEELDLSEEYIRGEYEAPGVQDHWFVPLISVSEERFTELDPVLRPVPGIFFRREESRVYPAPYLTGHLTGYMGEVTGNMIDDYPELDFQPGDRAGRSGLEQSQEEYLRGRPGYQFYTETEENREILAETPPAHGQDIHTTLDLSLQEAALDVLVDKNAAFVVLDAEKGEILTLTSSPGFDPNEFVRGIGAQRWQELNQDPDRPLFNRAAQGRYPPGSTFKVLTAAAALDKDIYEPDSEFDDSGELVVEGNRIRNFREQVFQEHTLTEAIIHSINTTMAGVGLEMGAGTLQEYFEKLHLDGAPAIGLPVRSGQLGRPAQSRVNLAWTAIGQDQVLMTPMHMAHLFAVFAAEGYLPELTLLTRDVDRSRERVLEEDTVSAMNDMLAYVVSEGTGAEADRENGFDIFGKTGTAEVAGQTPHAWFAGHVDNGKGRRLSFAVLVENAGVGGENAAPLAASFWQKVYEGDMLQDMETADEVDILDD